MTTKNNLRKSGRHGLKKLLDGSGLSFKQVSATTIAINSATTTRADPDPPAAEPAASPADNESHTKGDPNMTHRGFFTRLASLLALSGATRTLVVLTGTQPART